MSLEKQRALSPEKWLTAIKQVLAQFPEFSNTSIVFDAKNSFDDVLEFDINDYYGDLNSRVSEKLNERFGNLVTMLHSPDTQNSRRKIITIKVTRPDSPTMDMLERTWEKQSKILSSFTLSRPILFLLLLFALSQVGFAFYLSYSHAQSRSDPFSLLIHWVVMCFVTLTNKLNL